jgi:hypothetical protein
MFTVRAALLLFSEGNECYARPLRHAILGKRAAWTPRQPRDTETVHCVFLPHITLCSNLWWCKERNKVEQRKKRREPICVCLFF